jgi:hypothetical protein
MVRWNDAHAADFRARVAQGTIRTDTLTPEYLWGIAVKYYPETIPTGQYRKQTVLNRFRTLLLKIRAEIDLQGARRRGNEGGGKNIY